MKQLNHRALDGTRIWLSGSITNETNEAEAANQAAIVAEISRKIFRAGGSIIHGSHPTIWPILLRSAREFQKAGGSRDCLVLGVSRYFSNELERNGVRLDEWRSHSIVHQVPADGGEYGRESSLRRLRHWIAERCDAIIVVGGNWWDQNPGGAGLPSEFELARQRGLPCFLLAGLGGAAAGYMNARPDVIVNLKNGLSEDENRRIATETDVDTLSSTVVNQLCRLPLVRGEMSGSNTFRILSLDGGGIKGTFTASVLAGWERLTKVNLAEHFDLIAGTSTGGILALGLGMGLSAAKMLDFYEKRGPTVFPVTSLRGKMTYGLRSLVQPKFPQDVLRRELESAFQDATGKYLSDSRCRLVIPACHARTGGVHIFRTNHHTDLTADAGVSATAVAAATAAAPTYFRAAQVESRFYVDGGVWANNPTMVALVEAVARLRVPLNHIDILSVGTTSAPYSGRETLTAGLAGWLWKGRIVELLMHAQAQATSELANSLAGRPRLLRIDHTVVPGQVSLDSINRIEDLKDYGMEAASHPEAFSQVRARFLNGIPVESWKQF